MADLAKPRIFEGKHGLVTAIMLSLLIASVVFSQFYRKMPAWQLDLVDSDSLANIDLVRQLKSGQVVAEEWVTATAPFWLTEVLPAWALMSVTGGNWRLTLALFSVAMSLLVIWSLTVVVRQASGFSFVQSWLAATFAVASLTMLIRYAGSWSGNFGLAQRPFSVVAFFFAGAGLAKLATGGRASVRLAWAYLACCLVFGASDALIGFHVALPVLMASLWWLHLAKEAQAKKTVVYAAMGVVLVPVGYWGNGQISPFLDNSTDLVNKVVPTALALASPSLSRDDAIADVFVMISAIYHLGTEWLSETMLGDNLLNGLFALSVLPLCVWAIRSGACNKDAQKQAILQDCTMTMIVVMLLSLIASCLAIVLFLFQGERYMWPMYWAPFLFFASMVAVWIMLLEEKRVAYALTGIVAFALMVDLAFSRYEDVVSQRVACSGDILNGTEFERGMVGYWHAREVEVVNKLTTNHLVYYSEGSLLHAYPHVGNMRHNLGTADYAVAEPMVNPQVINNFNKTFGLPSRIAACDAEAYLLYGEGRLDSNQLFVLSGIFRSLEAMRKKNI